MTHRKALNLITALGLMWMLVSSEALATARACREILTAVTPQTITAQNLDKAITDLARLRFELDLEKTEGTTMMSKNLSAQYDRLFLEVSQSPFVKLSVFEIKNRIKTEIRQLQNLTSVNKEAEIAARKKQDSILEKFRTPVPRATVQQLEQQHARAKEIFNRYNEKAIEIPWLKKLLAQSRKIPNHAAISEGRLDIYDHFLQNLSTKYGESFARIEVLDRNGNSLGESTTQLGNAPMIFMRTAVSMSLGEAWSKGRLFEIAKINITLSHPQSNREKMKSTEIAYFTDFKRLLEVLEFTDVAVEGAVLLPNPRGLHKRTILISAQASAMLGDYHTSWNIFHQANNRMGEFNGPEVYGQRIYENDMIENEYRITLPYRKDYADFLIDNGLQ